MLITNPAPNIFLSWRKAEIRFTTAGVVGFLKSVSPALRVNELPSKSMSIPSNPNLLTIDATDDTKFWTSALVVNCTIPLAPPIDKRTALPRECRAATSEMNCGSPSGKSTVTPIVEVEPDTGTQKATSITSNWDEPSPSRRKPAAFTKLCQ